MSFIGRRIGFYLIALWASVTLNFFLPRLMPGDPASAIFARFQGQARPEQIEAMRTAYGLSDAPLYKQYWTYLTHLARGDLGLSISSFPSPVTDVIRTSLWWTLLLGAVALILSFLIGTILGIMGAWRRSGALDSILPPFLLFTGSFPYFWLATVALFILGFKLDLLPLRHAYAAGMSPEFSFAFV